MKLPEVTPEQVSQAMELIPSLWAQKYKIKTSKGMPMEFDSNHTFMRDLFDDMSPLQVWLKPPQVGASETEIVKSLYCARMKGWDIIYTLPTDTDRDDMAGGKTNRIIAQNAVLAQWTTDHDTVEQKSVGENIIHYRGTFTKKKAMMVSSDLNIHDEVDASDPEVIVEYENRLEANPHGRRWYFSHPSLSSFGVDIYWQQSDKHEWFVTCPHCFKEIILASEEHSWKDSIDFDRAEYICRLCKKDLPIEAIRNGVWKPTAQGLFRGYHISQLMCPWITARKIIQKYYDPQKNEQFFYNYVLGLPYVGSENKISSKTVLKNVSEAINTQSPRIIIGVDTGLPWHLTCMNSEGVFYFEKLKNPGEQGVPANYNPKDRVAELLRRWDRSIVIGDQGGDLTPLRILQQEFPGRVFLVYYRKDRKSLETIKWGEGEDLGLVTVDRNSMFQLMVEQLRDLNRIRLNGSADDWKEWAEHFDNVYREVKTAKNSPGKDVATNYGQELIWKRNGADHFCHTLLYCLVGMDRYATALAQIIKKDPFMAGVQTGSNADGTIRAGSNLKRYGSFNSQGGYEI